MKKKVCLIVLIILMLAGLNINAAAFQEEADAQPTKENREKLRKRMKRHLPCFFL